MTPPARTRLSEAERRDQIVAAAVTTIAASGYDGASLSTIARTAGVSKGLILHYFTDKEDLMRQTATITLGLLTRGIADRIDLNAPVPDVIRSAIREVSTLPYTHGAELAALNQVVANLRGPDGTPALSLKDYEVNYLGQEELFRRGQRDGSLRAFDTRVMAVSYQGAVDAMLAYLAEHPEIDSAAYASELADIIVAAIT